MGTRANYIFETKTFHRSCDGYPEVGGLELANYLLKYGNNTSHIKKVFGEDVKESDNFYGYYEYQVYDNYVIVSPTEEDEQCEFTFEEFYNYCNGLPLDYPTPTQDPPIPNLLELGAIRLHPVEFQKFKKASINEQISILNRVYNTVNNQTRHVIYAAFAF